MRRLSHMHPRRTRRIRNRHRLNRPRSKHSDRRTMVQSTSLNKVPARRKTPERSLLKRHNPEHNKRHRRRRRTLQGNGIQRLNNRLTLNRSPHDNNQHGNRSRRKNRHNRTGPKDNRLPKRPDIRQIPDSKIRPRRNLRKDITL